MTSPPNREENPFFRSSAGDAQADLRGEKTQACGARSERSSAIRAFATSKYG